MMVVPNEAVLVCGKCDFQMPYGPEIAETKCPAGYPHDWTYPNMVRVMIACTHFYPVTEQTCLDCWQAVWVCIWCDRPTHAPGSECAV